VLEFCEGMYDVQVQTFKRLHVDNDAERVRLAAVKLQERMLMFETFRSLPEFVKVERERIEQMAKKKHAFESVQEGGKL